MCTVLLAYRAHPRYRLILAANRDEFYERPTAPAGFWDDVPGVFAGRDLRHGGTWLGVTASGRIAALTNYRDPAENVSHRLSRGHLVSEYLAGESSTERYLESLRAKRAGHNGYNLLLGDMEQLYCYSNRTDEIAIIEPGVHGLSNHLLDTPWPKVARGKEALARLLSAEEVREEELFEIVGDRSRAPDEELPETGVGLEWERVLSAIFITSERYGTRSSSILSVGEDLQARFVERSFDSGALRESRVTFDWSAKREER